MPHLSRLTELSVESPAKLRAGWTHALLFLLSLLALAPASRAETETLTSKWLNRFNSTGVEVNDDRSQGVAVDPAGDIYVFGDRLLVLKIRGTTGVELWRTRLNAKAADGEITNNEDRFRACAFDA